MSNLLFASSTAHRHPFTPIWLEKRNPKPVFHFRAGSLADRAQYLADLDTLSGGEVYPFQFDAAFRDGLAALLPDRDDQPGNADERAALLELMNADRSGQVLDASDEARFADVWNTIKANWPPMLALERRSVLRAQLIPMYAMLHFCTGLEHITDREGVPVSFETDSFGRISETTILRIDPDELIFAGRFAHNLQFGASAEKNFASPSKSDPTPGASTADTKASGTSRRTRSGTKRSSSPKTR
jgi:hypothetical protein